jgi:outer membrane protein assembly factor BamB
MRTSLLCLFLAGLAPAQWPQFRGPNASGVSAERGLPAEFGPEKSLAWKTPLPPGNSSPALAGPRIFLTAAEGDQLLTLCLDLRTGRERWRRAVTAARKEALHKLNHPASATPVTDGRNVYVFFGDFGLVSYDAEGGERWRLPLGPFNNLHGMAASPVLAGGKLLQVCDQDTGAYLLAVDPQTGKPAWKTERDVSHGFSTPVVYRPAAGPEQVIVPGSYQLIAYSVATGEKLWWVRGLTWQSKSAPVLGGDVLYFSGWAPGADPGEQLELPAFSDAAREADVNRDGRLAQPELPKPWQPTGSWRAIDFDQDGLLDEREWSFFRARRSARNGLLAVKLGGRGDVTASHVLWRHEKSLPDVPSPLLYEGVLYLVRTGGIATSLNPQTGEVLKQARLRGALEGYYSSPVGVDGKVYMASQEGKVVVLQAGGDWEILAVNDLGEEIYATPAVAGGRLYVRTRAALYAFGN